MTTATAAAVAHMASSSCTRNPRDLAVQALMIRGAHDAGARRATVRAILDARAGWVTWLTITQRQWQRETRRPNRARHHDSIQTRDRYVRCA